MIELIDSFIFQSWHWASTNIERALPVERGHYISVFISFRTTSVGFRLFIGVFTVLIEARSIRHDLNSTQRHKISLSITKMIHQLLMNVTMDSKWRIHVL